MLDITKFENGSDLLVEHAIVPKAGNVLSIQLGDLEYIPDFGIDLKFFLLSDFEFENDSFKAYLIQRLTEHQVNVGGVLDEFEALYEDLTFKVGDNSRGSGNGGFVL